MLACIFWTTFSVAQSAGLKLTVKVEHQNKPYSAAKVVLLKSNSNFDQVRTGADGVFAYTFDYGAVYHLQFTGEGLITKTLEVDLTSVPLTEAGNTHDWELGSITLFKKYVGADVSVFEKPVGRVFWDVNMNDYSIDYKYGRKVSKAIEKSEVLLQELEKQELAMAKENSKSANELIKNGDNYFKQNDFESALVQYKKAFELDANSLLAKTKVADTEKRIADEKRYKQLVLEADGFFRNEEWAQAKDRYNLALQVKPLESYPKSQLNIVLENQKKQQERDNQYNNFIALGDASVISKNYKAAAAQYNKAILINPDGELAKKKLQEVESKLSAAEKAEQEKRNQFDQILVKARESYQAGNMVAAQQELDKAAKLYPMDEDLKEEKRDFAIAKREQEAKLAEEKAEQQKQQQFKEYKLKAQQYAQSGDKSMALLYYKKAASINSSDPMVNSRIESLQRPTNTNTQTTTANNTAIPVNTNNLFAELDKMDKNSETYTNALGKKFPEGLTEKTYKEGSKTITRRIVVKGGQGTEYQKIKHNWGGVYYFKNGNAITEYIWEKESTGK